MPASGDDQDEAVPTIATPIRGAKVVASPADGARRREEAADRAVADRLLDVSARRARRRRRSPRPGAIARGEVGGVGAAAAR